MSWHHQSPEKRSLRRNKLGPPDVYPQEPKQEEDNLGADRLKKGYQIAITSYEHDSMVWNSKLPRLDRMEDSMSRGAQFIMQIMTKKNELNANLDKERKRANKDGFKEGIFQHLNQSISQAAKSKERKEWFIDLARGKPLSYLIKKAPFFRKKEDALEYMCDFKVPVYRCLWFLKLLAVAQGIASNVNKQKRSTSDQLAAEHAALFSKYVKIMLTQMSESTNLEMNIVYSERWPHFICLCKHAYEDGMLERQEFLMDLCDIFADRFVQRSQRSPHFYTLLRMFLAFFAQFADQITQNMILSRRCAFLTAKRLAIHKIELEEALERRIECREMFDEFLQCQRHRPIILMLCGLLYGIIIDCPAALVWNNFTVAEDRLPSLMHQLCGSPLDQLPCDIEDLPMPSGDGIDKVLYFIHLRVDDVKRRSMSVENHWSLNQMEKDGFALTVRACIEILGALDSSRHDRPQCIERICSLIFDGHTREKFVHEHVIRVKTLLQWAVSAEREGTHRALRVARVLANRINSQRSFRFGIHHIQDILVEYLETEGPLPSQPNFHEEFGNLMLLFVELLRAGVFSHDLYAKSLISNGEMMEKAHIMSRFSQKDPMSTKVMTPNTVELSSSQEKLSNWPQDEYCFWNDNLSKKEKVSNVSSVDCPASSDSFLDSSVTVHERFLIHLPIPQRQEYRSECNQRLLLLYGMGMERENVKNELKKIAREITKIWTKRITIEFSLLKPSEIRFKRRINKEQIADCWLKFKSQTYYDQVVMCGWCCDNFISIIAEFLNNQGTILPGIEGLDMLLGMMEHCKNIYGLMEFVEEVLPLLTALERVIAERRIDCVPCFISHHYAYILVAYLSHNHYYFLMWEASAAIINGLYRVIESQVNSPESYVTGWGRTIAIYILCTKKELYETCETNVKMEGKREMLLRFFPQRKHISSQLNPVYHAGFFSDLLDENKRIFSFNDYGNINALFENPDFRYSFVISAIICAKHSGRDFDRLVDLANICGHVSAHSGLSSEWCSAILALACSDTSANYGYAELLLEVNVHDYSCHPSIATFYMLLAARSCFSINVLFEQLLHSALGAKVDADGEAGACFALLIIASIVCQNDEPITLPSGYCNANVEKKKLMGGNADRWILFMGHHNDISDAIFDLLFTVSLLAEFTKSKYRDRIEEKSEFGYKCEHISLISRAVLVVMCEQDWLMHRMYRICEETSLDIFNSNKLKKNCLGQQVLRMILRRKCERGIIQELTICNGNSKKSLIDKLFNVLSIWNIRATYFDLKLMIKEISPEGSSSKHAQQQAIAADALIGEIGKCCRDLFTLSRKNETKLPEVAVGIDFRFKHVNKYWLISSLVDACPKPSNLPQSFPPVTVQSKFLKEAASMFDTANDNSRERVHQSVWLLSQEPFINLVLTCIRSEEQQRDGLVGSLLKQLQDLTSKTKENPTLPYLRSFYPEREGFLLRLSLVGGMFDSVCHPSNCDSWALLFYQLMLYGIISRERDKFLFDYCYDMLSILLIWSVADPMSATPTNSQDPDTKYRFNNYSSIIRKLRKELNDRALIPELRSLMQFLPLTKPSFDIISCEPYGAVVVSPQKVSKNQGIALTGKMKKQGLQFCEKVKFSSFDMIQNHNSELYVKRAFNWTMFQAVKVDGTPLSIQRNIQRIIHHSHYNEFVRPIICGMDRSPNLDIYLSPPIMDVSEAAISLHHGPTNSTTPITASVPTPSIASASQSVPMSLANTVSLGVVDQQTTNIPQNRQLAYQPDSLHLAQDNSNEGMMFAQPSRVPSISEITRGQSNSPRGTRGGRRRQAAGVTNRSQGTTRKKQKQVAEQMQMQAAGPVMNNPSTSSAPIYGWGSQPALPQMQPYANSSQAAMMNQSEDSKMKIHSMILQKRQQVQVASGGKPANMPDMNAYQNVGQHGERGSQYGQPMMMKMENPMQIDNQQSYSLGAQQMILSQDQQAAQYPQQRVYPQQQQQPTAPNMFDNRLMGHQQGMQYGQPQYQQQF